MSAIAQEADALLGERKVWFSAVSASVRAASRRANEDGSKLRRAGHAASLAAVGRAVYAALVETLCAVSLRTTERTN